MRAGESEAREKEGGDYRWTNLWMLGQKADVGKKNKTQIPEETQRMTGSVSLSLASPAEQMLMGKH